MNHLLCIYICVIGVMLPLIAVLELCAPLRIYRFLSGWTAHRLFPLHGLFFILAGFPLTLFDNPSHPIISKIILIVGVVMVLTGPFIILYSENIRSAFAALSETADSRLIRRIIYCDACLRIIMGMMFLRAGCDAVS